MKTIEASSFLRLLYPARDPENLYLQLRPTIPKQVSIAFCAITKSGKTQFYKNHFKHKNKS